MTMSEIRDTGTAAEALQKLLAQDEQLFEGISKTTC